MVTRGAVADLPSLPSFLRVHFLHPSPAHSSFEGDPMTSQLVMSRPVTPVLVEEKAVSVSAALGTRHWSRDHAATVQCGMGLTTGDLMNSSLLFLVSDTFCFFSWPRCSNTSTQQWVGATRGSRHRVGPMLFPAVSFTAPRQSGDFSPP